MSLIGPSTTDTVCRVKTPAWIAIGSAVVVGGVVWFIARSPAETAPSEPTTQAHTPAPAAIAAPPPPGRTDSVSGSEGPSKLADSERPYPVDLDDLRARIPNNLYWQLGAPTDDPEVAKMRAARAERNNTIFGRTLSGEATEAEIRTYYAEQRRVSEDYLELSLLVLSEKRDQLPERDRGMFELSVQLHRARIAQTERDLKDALARRRK